jgi:hypothetical protein
MKEPSKLLLQTRKKVSRKWKHYRLEKKKIFHKKRLPLDVKKYLIEEQRKVTRQNIHFVFSDYRELKYSRIHVSKYKGLRFVRKVATTNTIQEYYKLGTNINDLDSKIDNVLNKPRVSGLLLIFRVMDEESELIHNVSEYITKFLFDRLQLKGISMYDNLSSKLKYSKSVHEYELKGIYIRVIYEKSKKDNN